MTFLINSPLLCCEALAAKDRMNTANSYLMFTFKLFGSWHRFETFVLLRFYNSKCRIFLENVVSSRDPRSQLTFPSALAPVCSPLSPFFFTTSEISGLPQPLWYLFWQVNEKQVANYFYVENRPLPVFVKVGFFLVKGLRKSLCQILQLPAILKSNPNWF